MVNNMEQECIRDLMELKGKDFGKMGKSFNGFDNLFKKLIDRNLLFCNNYYN